LREKFLLSVVVPMYFEEEVVDECYKKLTSVLEDNQYNYEIVFVNDGSTDKTPELLKALADRDKRVKVVDFSRNFGHQTAVTCGIDMSKGDAIVIIDADLQDPPEVIKSMVDLWKQGYDVVYGKRAKRKGETWFKLATAKMFYKFLQYMSEVKIPRDTGDFRLIDRKVAEVFKAMPERNRFIRGMIAWIGFNQTFVEYERDERFAGETKYPLKKMLKFAADGIIGFSSKPLKLIANLGVLTVVFSFLIIVYSILSKIFGKNVESGWTSIMLAVTFFGGVQMIAMGILGEYIARIYDESKNRPLYIVKDKRNFDE
jgi:glycosyltransferase involved in cell wall biosynthesis